MNTLFSLLKICAAPKGCCPLRAGLVLVAVLHFPVLSQAQPPPLVYDVENTGAQFPAPVFPAYDQLPVIQRLPDPFKFFDGSPRDTSFASWERRRNEIKASIEKYEIGPKPDKSDLSITAVYTPGSPGLLTVDVLRLSNNRTLRLTSTINLPSGVAPAAGWPALIRMALAPGVGANSLGIATIDYVHDDVTQYAAGVQVSHAADPYFLMYPEYNAGPCPPAPAPCGVQVGQYSAWAWGVSRLIDGMEIARKQIVNPLPIDLRHLGVNGCSYAGKMALFAGAFDERIAATFAQESGGGGAPAWRVSHGIEPEGTVEKSNNTDGSWFITGFKTSFGRDNIYKLPTDHHELMAMIAPRALFVSGNTDFTWLSNRANYVTAKATQHIYETLGVGDRFGYYIDGGHGHCAVPATQQIAVNNFYRKFLAGEDIAWDVHVFPQTAAYTSLNWEEWMPWAWERTATVTLSSLNQTYDGAPKPVTVTTDPAGLAVDLTYDDSPTAPTNADSYLVIGRVNDPEAGTMNDPHYTGSSSDILTINKAPATIVASNLTQTYTGSPKAPSIATNPAGLTVDITYDGSASAPANAGAYALVATMNEQNYAGTITGVFTINKATAGVTLSNLIQRYDGTPKSVSVATDPSGLAVDVTYNGSDSAPVLPGTYAVTATVNNPNYSGTASGTLRIKRGNPD